MRDQRATGRGFAVTLCAAAVAGVALAAVSADRAAVRGRTVFGALSAPIEATVGAGGVLIDVAAEVAPRLAVPVALVAVALSAWALRRRPHAILWRAVPALALGWTAQSFLLSGLLVAGCAAYAAAIATWVSRRGPPAPVGDSLSRAAEGTWLMACLALFAVFALYRLDVFPDLYFDEVAYLRAASMQLGQLEPGATVLEGGRSVYSLDQFRSQTIPFVLQTAVVGTLAPGVVATRIASFMAMAAALLVAALTLRERLGPRATIGMLALCATAPLALVYSRAGFYIAFSVLHAALCFGALLRLAERWNRSSAVVAGALLGASLYFYQASWFVPIFAAATEFAVPGLWHRPGRRRIGLFVGITALVVLLPGLLALRGGLSDVTAQTLDRAVWNRWDERGGDSALIVLPEEVDKASVAEFRTRFGDDELRVATSQSTGDRDVLLLQGPRRRVEPAVVAAEDEAWTVLRTPWVSYSIAGRGLQMLRQLFYAPSPESSGRWVDAPLLNPLIAPLFVLGLVEALRRRREPIVRMLLVWTVCAAFVPAVVGGVVPRRAVLMLPFAWALMVLPLREIGAAVVGRGPRALLAALGVGFLAAVVATDAHLYFRNWDQRFAVQIGGREILELAKVVKALPPEEVVIVPGLYRDYQLYALESRVLGRSGAVIVATDATTPGRVAEVSCRQTIPFTWATLDTPKHHERFRYLENDFVYRVEPAGIFRMLRVVVRKQHACETRR